MTSPSGFGTANLLTEPAYSAMLISGTEQSVAIASVLGTAVTYGYSATIQVYGDPQTQSAVWRFTITDSAGNNQYAYQGDWMVLDGSILTFYTAAEFAAKFTTNTPVIWTATTVAPTAVAVTGLEATLSFQQPTSADSPFTYSATGDGSVGDFITDSNGNVTTTISGLTEGSQYSWTVTVTTQYDGVTATSMESNLITAYSVEGS